MQDSDVIAKPLETMLGPVEFAYRCVKTQEVFAIVPESYVHLTQARDLCEPEGLPTQRIALFLKH